jgi:hypothetical protein
MRRLLLAILAIPTATLSAHALDARIRSGLLKLDPVTRLEQRCDVEALDRIAKDDKRFTPDRVVAYATQEPKMEGDEIRTRGGAFRSKGEWYHVSYRCRTAPDHMEILSFRYAIGDLIPEDQWEQYNLYP